MPYRLRLLLVAALLLASAAWTGVQARAEEPVCSFWESATVMMAGNPIAFQDTSYDPDGDPIVSWQWDFGDGSSASGSPNVVHTYMAAGTFLVCLEVCDDTGECSFCCETKTISEGGEEPVCLIWESTHSAAVGTVIVFDGGGSFDPDGGAIIQWVWDFGDGNVDAGSLVSHRYAASGPYIVRLTVTDDQGEIASCSEDKRIYDILYPLPEFIEPIDPMWYEPPPVPDEYYPPPLAGTDWPVSNVVTLYVTEANGRESKMKPPTPDPDENPGDIEQCRFEFSLDGGINYNFIDMDYDGTTPTLSGPPPTGYPPTSDPQYDCWSAEWDLDTIKDIDPTFDEGLVRVRATMWDLDGYPGDSFFDVYCDLTPPKPTELHPVFPEAGGEYEVYEEGSTIPLGCHIHDDNVEEVEWYFQPIPRRYKKGVPLMNQNTLGPTWCANDGAMWCAPTANASCLKWWATGGGIPRLWPAARPDWVNRWRLARLMRTSCLDGTTVANQIRGARAWIALHGGCFVVSGPMRATPWRYIRELANCREDVLLYWWWDDDPSSGGHEVTGNSFNTVAKFDPVGLFWYWDIDYMDPCTGTYVWTKMTAGGRIEVPPNSNRWHQAWMKTISPRRVPWPPFPPGEPWWPSCEVPTPPVCEVFYTQWDLLDPTEWMGDEPVPAGLYLLKCQAIEKPTIGPTGDVRHMMSDTTIVEILDTDPTCDPVHIPPMPMVGELVHFESNAWDGGNPGGIGLTCTWDFGDGTPLVEGYVADHVYGASGDWPLTLTVQDDEGNEVMCTDVVHVQLQPEPPGPVLLDPIDPVWVDRRPPLTGQVELRCTEATGREGLDGGGDIQEVMFYIGPTPTGPWVLIGTDTTSETMTEANGPYPISDPQYTWWSCPFDLDTLGGAFEGPLFVRALMTDAYGQTGEDVIEVWVDVTPPQPEIYEPSPGPEVIPEYPEGTTIDLVCHNYDENVIIVNWWWQPKLEWYVKGVPPLNQHNYGAGCANDGNMYCAPTAWASCFKWWDANGYPNLVPAGMTDAQLVAGLAAAMNTTCNGGTTVNNQILGARNWIANHGGGLHVAGPSAVTPKGIRNQLENCKEDVLFGIYWNTGGGHRVTANSFLNIFDMVWLIDFMNPSNGLIESTSMTSTGQLEYPPGSGSWHSTGNMITVSPDDPGPWWPSCEVEPPPVSPPYHPVCERLYTYWDLNDPTQWQDPLTPMAGNRLYLLRCDMWDDTNHMMDDTIVIKITDLLPTCAPTHVPEPAQVGDPVMFDSGAYDAGNPGGIGLLCDWDFGDGGGGGGGCEPTEHTYMTPGVYTATCKVQDDEGNIVVCTDQVAVEPIECEVICQGSYCGGGGGRKYQYEVTAPLGTEFDYFEIGVEDLDTTHYTNEMMPAGWTMTVLADPPTYYNNGFTPHGTVSAATGVCAGALTFSGPAIPGFVFGFDHPGPPHDVGWLVACTAADCLYPLVCKADWNEPVGIRLGPVHSPMIPAPPVPVPLEPIDPAWIVDRPPVSNDPGPVPLYCRELNFRTGTDDPSDFGDIAQVTVECAAYDGARQPPAWILIGTDTTGATPSAGLTGPVQYDWWCVDWDVGAMDMPEGPYQVRVTMTDIYGQTGESFFDVYADPTPPKPDIYHPVEYQAFDEGSTIDLICHTWDENVVQVDWWWQPKQEVYKKGVPPLNQHDYGYTGGNCPKHPAGCPNDGNMWCVPTASASCLQWWAAHGFPGLEPPGMTKAEFVEKLATLMRTDCELGTTGPDQAQGLRDWIASQAVAGLHVTGPSPVTALGLRNELENCKEDVLFWLGVWDEWWHGVTLNSFRNRPIGSDIWEIDYMDPDDASIQWTEIRADGTIKDRSGNWVSTLNMITVSPDIPTEPWWPSCEVEPPPPPEPHPFCEDLITQWNLSDPNHWMDPNTPMAVGLYLLKCRMTDSAARVMDETIVIEILDLPPVCAITYAPAAPKVGDTVTFNANASDPGGGAVTCAWDFGDFTGGVGCLINHVYTAAGAYNVMVTVTDDEGSTTTCTALVTVAPGVCRVLCHCTGCDVKPVQYKYDVTGPAGLQFDELLVGTDDPVAANYSAMSLPPGWDWTIISQPLVQHNKCTAHGDVSIPSERCPHFLRFFGPAINNGVFSYKHPSEAHDVGWQVREAGGILCVEDWMKPVGEGEGPLHAPKLPPAPDPVVIEPIDPVWVEWAPTLTGLVTLYCTEGTGRTGMDDPGGTGDIASVRFEVGYPGGPYTLIGEDTTGDTVTLSEAPNDAPPVSEHQYGYWSVEWDTDTIPTDLPPDGEGSLECKVTMTDRYGQSVDSFFDVYVDRTPPYPEIQSPVHYQAFEEGAHIPLKVHCWDDGLVAVAWWWQPIPVSYKKNVPLMNQLNFGAAECGLAQDGRMWCVPTAWASCLKYWAANGYPGLTAGLTDQQLVSGLAAAMGTSCFDGTTIPGQTKGGRAWIAGHGGGLRVSGPFPGSPWRYIKELANCKEDVLLVIWWNGGGGHEVTGNSFNLIPNADGTYNIDWMDPWGGVIVNTKMDAAGRVEYPPGSGNWHRTEIKTVSPNRTPWPPYPPGVPPWWPSCEVEPPFPDPCEILYTEWDLNDPSEWSDPETPMTPGYYLMRCDIQDDSGHMMSETTVIEIVDALPTCDVTYWSETGPPYVTGEAIVFEANAYEPGGGAVTCKWDFGDGGTRAGCEATHTYTTPGAYMVCVYVTDDEGNTVECCEEIVIEQNPVPQLCLRLKGNCWHMITLPCYAMPPDPWIVFEELRPPYKPWDLLSGKLHRYDHFGMTYVPYESWSPAAFGDIIPGDGYWLNLFEDETFCYDADCTGLPEMVDFPTHGWYLMGSPQPTDTYIDDTRWYYDLGGPAQQGPYPFSVIMNLWVMDPFVGHSCELNRYFSMGILPIDEYHDLWMFQGYWMYAFEDKLTMVVPP